MVRIHFVVGLIVPFLLLVMGCNSDSSQPTGPLAEKPHLATSVSEKFHFHDKGVSAFAAFQENADPPCHQTEISVSENQQLGQTAGGHGQLFITMQAGDACGGGTVVAFSSPITGLTFHIQGNLKQATLQGTTMVQEDISGTEVPVVVNLLWTGTGALESFVSHFRSKDPASLFIEHSKLIERSATVTGTMLVNGVNVVFNPLGSGSLARSKGDTLEIRR
jgi:hypothetical protein